MKENDLQAIFQYLKVLAQAYSCGQISAWKVHQKCHLILYLKGCTPPLERFLHKKLSNLKLEHLLDSL